MKHLNATSQKPRPIIRKINGYKSGTNNMQNFRAKPFEVYPSSQIYFECPQQIFYVYREPHA